MGGWLVGWAGGRCIQVALPPPGPAVLPEEPSFPSPALGLLLREARPQYHHAMHSQASSTLALRNVRRGIALLAEVAKPGRLRQATSVVLALAKLGARSEEADRHHDTIVRWF